MKGFLQLKMDNRCGGRPVYLLGAMLIAIALSCVREKVTEPSVLKEQIDKKLGYSYTFLAAILNQPVQSEKETTFLLQKPTDIHVFGTAELDINLVSVPERYFFKSDGIELYFRTGSSKVKTIKSLIYSVQDFRNRVDTIIAGANFFGHYDPQKRMYLMDVKVPWTELGVHDAEPGDTINFNSAIGDNDDKIKQDSKLTWVGNADPLYDKIKSFGKLVLVGENQFTNSNDSVLFSVNIKNVAEKHLERIPSSEIRNIAFGAINDTEDFSGRLKSFWTSTHLFIRFEINDSQPQVAVSNLNGSTSFHDYGMILNASGKEVWRMTVGTTSYSGGAAKNRKGDAIIHLKAGSYKLKYVTDESHSWDSWDDRPPQMNYHGIAVYEVMKAKK